MSIQDNDYIEKLEEEVSYLRAFHKQFMWCFRHELDHVKAELDEHWAANGRKLPEGY